MPVCWSLVPATRVHSPLPVHRLLHTATSFQSFTFYDVVLHSDNAVLDNVKTSVDKLKPLRQELKSLMKAVEDGKVDKQQAADKIIEIRTRMDEVIDDLKNSSK